jgi:EAL domain-containing protein (putative c-di-GMP-specific phosphodiesterase class I)
MSIGPDKFIPIAEESGLINDIGLWTIKEACSRMYQWSNRYPLKENNIVMSINLSAKQLLVSELLDNVEGILKAHFIDYGSIKFEITETALMENPDQASNILSNMVDKGISIAIDDFGTGHSSLSYIHRFPFDFLKIDKSFVSGMEKNKEVFEIVKSVISMARALNVKIIAEGVETESQLGILKDFGCEYAQGYLFDKPLPPDEAESKWLRNLRKKYNIE